jgi:hypothetical protein
MDEMNRWFGAPKVLLLVLLSWRIGAPAQVPVSTPKEIKASYRIYKSGVHIGNVDETFIREGDSYRLTSATETAGPLRIFLRDRLTVSAEGKITEQGLEPTRYELKRDNDATKHILATFDWSRQQIISTHNNSTESFVLPPGTLDRISAMYQFAFQEPRGDEVQIWMSQGKKAEKYRYIKQGEPFVDAGSQRYATVHFARDVQKGESRAQLWLAKDRFYLPVRMVFEDSRGLSLEQVLVSLQTR